MSENAYARAGVDVVAGEKAVALMKGAVASTHGPEVLGGIGGFAGMFDASALLGYRRPILTTSTDGVGTKVAIAQAMERYDTIGSDLVGMVVDDLVVCGAKPLFMTDYIACGKLVPEKIAAIVEGIAHGCAQAECALVGGETAEHPGLLAPDEFDVAGAATGVVEFDEILGSQRVKAGDVVVAMASSGLHSNGYSLARHVVAGAGWNYETHVDELGGSIGEALLVPTKIYAADCLALAGALDIHAFSHITGGGLADNLARVLPDDVRVELDRSTWTPGPLFTVLQEAGKLTRDDVEGAFNMGVGMVALLPQAQAQQAIDLCHARGIKAWECGTVVGEPGGTVALLNNHR